MSEEHDRWSADLGAYVLGALRPEETVALERHLERCERCQAELHWLGPARDVLPEAVREVSPPPELRERVMAEVHRDVARTRARPIAIRRYLAQPAVALALSLVLIVAAGIAGYALRGGGEDTKTLTARGPAGTPTAKLELLGDAGTLQLAHLRFLPGSRVYEVWIQHGKRLAPSSLFVAAADGRASAAIPGGLDDADAVLVSTEPQGGSRRPTSAPVLRIPLGPG